MKLLLLAQDHCQGDTLAVAGGDLTAAALEQIPFNNLCLGGLQFDRDGAGFSPEREFKGQKYAKILPTAEQEQSYNTYVTNIYGYILADKCFPVNVDGSFINPTFPKIDNSAMFNCDSSTLSYYNDKHCHSLNSTVPVENSQCFGGKAATTTLPVRITTSAAVRATDRVETAAVTSTFNPEVGRIASTAASNAIKAAPIIGFIVCLAVAVALFVAYDRRRKYARRHGQNDGVSLINNF